MKKILILLSIFILAFSVRLVYVFNEQSEIESDEIEHDNLAMRLIETKSYTDAAGNPTSYRPPLYPAFLALIYILFGHDYFILRFMQAILGALTVCILYLTCDRIFNKLTAVVVGIFSSFYMIFVHSVKFLYSETLFTFFLSLIVYLIVISNKPSKLKFCVVGFLSGFLTLIKSSGLFIPLIAIFFLARNIKKNNISVTKIIAPSILLLISFITLILPWTIRNFLVHDRFVLLSTNTGVNMYQGLCWAPGERFAFPPGTEMSARSSSIKGEIERNDFFIRETFRIYRERPLFALKMVLIRFLFFWNVVDWDILGGNTINYHYIFIFPFAIIGTISALREKKEIFSILFIILYFASFVLFFPGIPRYRMPIDGYLILLGSYGIYEYLNKQKRKIAPVFSTCSYFVFTYLLYRNSIEVKYVIKKIMEYIGLW